jgi:hypothetical protein
METTFMTYHSLNLIRCYDLSDSARYVRLVGFVMCAQAAHLTFVANGCKHGEYSVRFTANHSSLAILSLEIISQSNAKSSMRYAGAILPLMANSHEPRVLSHFYCAQSGE